MKLISQRIERRIKLALLATSALALLPVFSTSAQADPPSHAPAHGYYKNGKKDKSEKWDKKHRRDDVDYRDDDRDDRDDDWRNRNRRGRDDDWRDRDRRDRRNRDGDWRNNGGYNGSYGGGYNGGRSRYTITGTVTKTAGGNQFWVRGDNGQGYLVVTRSQTSVMNEGMRVQVTGQFDGTRIIADSVRTLGYSNNNNNNGGIWTRPGSGNNGGYNPGYNPGYTPGYTPGHNNDYSNGNVSFPGYVQSVSYADGATTLRVRGDNGQIYNVRIRSNTRFYNGQRVRVVGRYNDGWVWATSVR